MNKKKKRTDWLAGTRASLLVQLTNLKDKIGGFELILPYEKAKKDRLILVCETIIAVMTYTDQTRATGQQVTSYEDLLMTGVGGKQGDPAPAVPDFQTLTLPAGAFVGLIPELRDLVDDIKTADNYTESIGEDLMIVPPEGEDLVVANLMPALKVAPLPSTYKVRVEGSLQGMKAVRADWKAKGAATWQIGAGFLTKLPGEFAITPTVAGEPQSGELRFVFIEDSEPAGQFSLIHPVTVS